MKKLALLMALITVCVSVISCAENTTVESGGRTETETETETDTETETEAVEEPVFTVGGTDIKEFTLKVQEGGYACVRNAANELIEYLEDATDYRIEEKDGAHQIVIGVTDKDTEKVKAARGEVELDGYAIVEDGGSLYITGSCDRGTMYGVYCFLEDYLGVRFFAKDTTVVLEDAKVDVPEGLKTVHNPVFELRDTYWYDMRYDQTFANHSKDNSFYDSVRPVSDIGGGVGYAVRFVHTLGILAGTGHVVDKQPCLTDEAVYQTVLANVRAWLSDNPEAKIISISQNDSYAGRLGCQCQSCKAIDNAEGSPMGSLLTFINRIANDIKDEFPGVYVDTLAYRYTRKAPKTVRPAENVIIRLCSIECCFTHPLSDDECKNNVEFQKDIEEWAEICDKLYIWDYTYNAETYFTFFPNFDVLWDNVQFYKNNNVKGVFLEGQQVSVSGEFAELRSYLLAKLLWDPDMTKDEYYAHMYEFMEHYYGKGWEHIRTYMEEMTKHALKNPHVGIFDRAEQMFSLYNDQGKKDKTFSRDMLSLWNDALELAETEKQKAHVERSSLQAYYYCHLVGTTSQRKSFLNRVYELAAKYGIEYYKGLLPMPDESYKNDLNSLIK